VSRVVRVGFAVSSAALSLTLAGCALGSTPAASSASSSATPGAMPEVSSSSGDGSVANRLCVTNSATDEVTVLTWVAPTADGHAPVKPVTTGTTTNYGPDGVAEGEGPLRSGATACFSGEHPTVTIAFAGEEPVTLESDNPFVGSPTLGLYSEESDDFVKVELAAGENSTEEYLTHAYELARLSSPSGAGVEFAFTIRN
jgi:hypothetical protein